MLFTLFLVDKSTIIKIFYYTISLRFTLIHLLSNRKYIFFGILSLDFSNFELFSKGFYVTSEIIFFNCEMIIPASGVNEVNYQKISNFINFQVKEIFSICFEIFSVTSMKNIEFCTISLSLTNNSIPQLSSKMNKQCPTKFI
jgi:hypothetical protein